MATTLLINLLSITPTYKITTKQILKWFCWWKSNTFCQCYLQMGKCRLSSQDGRKNFKRRWQFYCTYCLQSIKTSILNINTPNIKHLFEPDDYRDFQEWQGKKLKGPGKMVKVRASFFVIKQMSGIFITVHAIYKLVSLKLYQYNLNWPKTRSRWFLECIVRSMCSQLPEDFCMIFLQYLKGERRSMRWESGLKFISQS